MSKNYVDYIVEETKKILSIDSPSGYTKEVAEYVMGEYKKLGYEPKLTVKGGILVAIGGKDNVASAAHCATRLRLVLNDESKVNKAEIEKMDIVKGVFSTA